MLLWSTKKNTHSFESYSNIIHPKEIREIAENLIETLIILDKWFSIIGIPSGPSRSL